MLLAFVALFMAIGGAAIAAKKAKKNTVVTKSIKNLAVKSSKLADGSVKAAKLGALIERTNTVDVADSGYNVVTAECLAGEKLISGGGLWDEPAQANFTVINESAPFASSNAWFVRGFNGSGTGTRKLTAVALCLGI
jgi:hypothetical protein